MVGKVAALNHELGNYPVEGATWSKQGRDDGRLEVRGRGRETDEADVSGTTWGSGDSGDENV